MVVTFKYLKDCHVEEGSNSFDPAPVGGLGTSDGGFQETDLDMSLDLDLHIVPTATAARDQVTHLSERFCCSGI